MLLRATPPGPTRVEVGDFLVLAGARPIGGVLGSNYKSSLQTLPRSDGSLCAAPSECYSVQLEIWL